MVLLRAMKRLIDAVLHPFGFKLVRENTLTDRQKSEWIGYSHTAGKLPEGAEKYLNWNNERLGELTRLYASMDAAVITPALWTGKHVQNIDLRYFRGDNPYIWQLKEGNFESAHAVTTYYIKTMDNLDLLNKLQEDDEFGIYTFRVADKTVSRDLLDSILEIYFLEKHLGISKMPHINLLDIGAGYGRLAYRMAEALPNIDNYFCTDAVPVSTFLSEYYLRFRKANDRARVIPLHEIQGVMADNSINIAVNINSFPECTLAAIDWWLRTIAKNKVRYLMIVPNDSSGRMITNRNEDFLPIIEKNGYRLLAKEPKYSDPIVQRCGVSPKYHCLFELF